MSASFGLKALIGIYPLSVIPNAYSEQTPGIGQFCLDQAPLRMAECIAQRLPCYAENLDVQIWAQ